MNPNTFNKITRLLNGESFITKEPGNSMLPLYKSNEEHLLTPITWEQCKVGDVVFCKVKGSCLTHKVYAIDSKKGCLIGNNKGHMNGWTSSQTKEMKTLKLFIRVLLIPVWITIFFIYLFIWYIQMSWYYFDFNDYWESYLLL